MKFKDTERLSEIFKSSGTYKLYGIETYNDLKKQNVLIVVEKENLILFVARENMNLVASIHENNGYFHENIVLLDDEAVQFLAQKEVM